jgi:hypothetical protein
MDKSIKYSSLMSDLSNKNRILKIGRLELKVKGIWTDGQKQKDGRTDGRTDKKYKR